MLARRVAASRGQGLATAQRRSPALGARGWWFAERASSTAPSKPSSGAALPPFFYVRDARRYRAYRGMTAEHLPLLVAVLRGAAPSEMSGVAYPDVFQLLHNNEQDFLNAAAEASQGFLDALFSPPSISGKAAEESASFLEDVVGERLRDKVKAYRSSLAGEGVDFKAHVVSAQVLRVLSIAVHRPGMSEVDVGPNPMLGYDARTDSFSAVAGGKASYNRFSGVFSLLPQPLPRSALFADDAVLRVSVLVTTVESAGGRVVGADSFSSSSDSSAPGARADDQSWLYGNALARRHAAIFADHFLALQREGEGGGEGGEGGEGGGERERERLRRWLWRERLCEVLPALASRSLPQFLPPGAEKLGLWERVESVLESYAGSESEAQRQTWREVQPLAGKAAEALVYALRPTDDECSLDKAVDAITELRFRRCLHQHVAVFELPLTRHSAAHRRSADEEEFVRRAEAMARAGSFEYGGVMPAPLVMACRELGQRSGLFTVPEPLVPVHGWRLVNWDEAQGLEGGESFVADEALSTFRRRALDEDAEESLHIFDASIRGPMDRPNPAPMHLHAFFEQILFNAVLQRPRSTDEAKDNDKDKAKDKANKAKDEKDGEDGRINVDEAARVLQRFRQSLHEAGLPSWRLVRSPGHALRHMQNLLDAKQKQVKQDVEEHEAAKQEVDREGVDKEVVDKEVGDKDEVENRSGVGADAKKEEGSEEDGKQADAPPSKPARTVTTSGGGRRRRVSVVSAKPAKLSTGASASVAAPDVAAGVGKTETSEDERVDVGEFRKRAAGHEEWLEKVNMDSPEMQEHVHRESAVLQYGQSTWKTTLDEGTAEVVQVCLAWDGRRAFPPELTAVDIASDGRARPTDTKKPRTDNGDQKDDSKTKPAAEAANDLDVFVSFHNQRLPSGKLADSQIPEWVIQAWSTVRKAVDHDARRGTGLERS